MFSQSCIRLGCCQAIARGGFLSYNAHVLKPRTLINEASVVLDAMQFAVSCLISHLTWVRLGIRGEGCVAWRALQLVQAPSCLASCKRKIFLARSSYLSSGAR